MKNKDNFPTLGSIVIGTKDIKKAKEFYTNVFGIKIVENSPNYLSAKLTDGTLVEIEEHSKERFPNWEINNIGTYKNSEFYIQDIFEFLATVKLNGGKIVSKPTKKPWRGYSAEIQDIGGNTFSITQK